MEIGSLCVRGEPRPDGETVAVGYNVGVELRPAGDYTIRFHDLVVTFSVPGTLEIGGRCDVLR